MKVTQKRNPRLFRERGWNVNIRTDNKCKFNNGQLMWSFLGGAGRGWDTQV